MDNTKILILSLLVGASLALAGCMGEGGGEMEGEGGFQGENEEGEQVGGGGEFEGEGGVAGEGEGGGGLYG